MPISMAPVGENLTIRRIAGNERIRKHLQNLGFIEGEPVVVVSKINENVIIKLKGISLAVTCDLAKKIYV